MIEDNKDAVSEVQAKESSKKSVRKKAEVKPKEPEVVVFRSRNEEPREFEVMGHRARRNASEPGRIEWHIPAEEAERFAKHFHVLKNRIQRVN